MCQATKLGSYGSNTASTSGGDEHQVDIACTVAAICLKHAPCREHPEPHLNPFYPIPESHTVMMHRMQDMLRKMAATVPPPRNSLVTFSKQACTVAAIHSNCIESHMVMPQTLQHCTSMHARRAEKDGGNRASSFRGILPSFQSKPARLPQSIPTALLSLHLVMLQIKPQTQKLRDYWKGWWQPCLRSLPSSSIVKLSNCACIDAALSMH